MEFVATCDRCFRIGSGVDVFRFTGKKLDGREVLVEEKEGTLRLGRLQLKMTLGNFHEFRNKT